MEKLGLEKVLLHGMARLPSLLFPPAWFFLKGMLSPGCITFGLGVFSEKQLLLACDMILSLVVAPCAALLGKTQNPNLSLDSVNLRFQLLLHYIGA